MKRHRRLLILALCSAFITFLCSCTDVKKTKFTVENSDKILSKLTVEERTLLTGAIARQSMANVFSGNSNPIPNIFFASLVTEEVRHLPAVQQERVKEVRVDGWVKSLI
jgi:hypothetical protein